MPTEALNKMDKNKQNLENVINEINKLTQSIHNRKLLILDESKTGKYVQHQKHMLEYEMKKICELENLLNQTEK